MGQPRLQCRKRLRLDRHDVSVGWVRLGVFFSPPGPGSGVVTASPKLLPIFKPMTGADNIHWRGVVPWARDSLPMLMPLYSMLKHLGRSVCLG